MRRYGEKVRIKSAESETAEDKGQIILRRLGWNVVGQADHVQRPEIVVFETLPEAREVHSLPVVHISLGRIVSQETIDEDLLLALREPALFATEPVGRLAWTWGHQSPAQNTDNGCDDAFDQE